MHILQLKFSFTDGSSSFLPPSDDILPLAVDQDAQRSIEVPCPSDGPSSTHPIHVEDG